jgi:serine/threonine protein kinase
MTKTTSAIWKSGDVILEQYEVTGILGQGGMGTVYQVHHRGWNTDLAMKTPKAEVFTNEGGKANFIREAETWVNLNVHPSIVSCYYVRTIEEIPCLFAEYVSGGSLASWIRSHRLYEGEHQQALARMLDVSIQFAWGLHAAHEQGLVHQDVKPANVMLTLDGSAKVTDFGLAQARAMAGGEALPDATAGQSILVSGGGMTPAYCSPEQAARQPLGRKTDIWSWAVSVLQMFVGKVTWLIGSVASEALANYLHQGAEDPRIPAMPADLATLLRHCFQTRPNDRPATMAEVAAALLEIYQQEVKQPYPHAAPRPAEALAATLNNRALSLYDLGKIEEAKQVWTQALQADPQHLEATYNRGLTLWRQAKLTDDALVHRLEDVRATHPDQWQPRYLLALVHLERGDRAAAFPFLEEATWQAPAETEVQALWEQTRLGTLLPDSHLYVFRVYKDWIPEKVSLSADGKVAFSKGLNQLQVWEVATGRCLRSLPHPKPVFSVSLSADGKVALSQCEDTMRVWDVATGECLQAFLHSKLQAISLSADGKVALSGSHESMQVWEIATGERLRTFRSHESEILTSVSLSADGRLVLSRHWGTVRLWEVATGRCLRTFQAEATSVSLSADGNTILSWSKDGTMQMCHLTHHSFLAPARLSQIRSYKDLLHIEEQARVLLLQTEDALGKARFALALGLMEQVRGLPGWERSPKGRQIWTKLLPYCPKVRFRAGWLTKEFPARRRTASSVSLSADGRLASSLAPMGSCNCGR